MPYGLRSLRRLQPHNSAYTIIPHRAVDRLEGQNILRIDQRVNEQFFDELEAAREVLRTGISELDMPLRRLVESQIEQFQPEVRAAVVLAAGVAQENDEALAATLRRQRIYLAAALEMLYVALNVHRLLLQNDAEQADRSLLGGTILAGDYCFSLSANLAVETNNPQVVALFSRALKEASEGNLRHVFALEDDDVYSENLTLCLSGAQAAAVLAMHAVGQGDESTTGMVLEIVQMLIERLEAGQTPSINERRRILDLPTPQHQRFACLHDWLFETNHA